MATNSAIQWTHHTFNPWRGCTKVSEGCANCYAETLSGRNPKVLGIWGKSGARVVAADSYWREPYKWAKVAEVAGERHRVFCASLADICEDETTMPAASVSVVAAARERLARVIRETSHALDWLLLSKRPGNFTRFYPEDVLRRCWVGTSVENQARADERIPKLLSVRASVRFLSCEPLLGAVNLSERVPGGIHGGPDIYVPGLHWVIVGGESGGGSRPFDPAWARDIRDQCKEAGVAFFMKQMGQRPVGLTVKGKGGDEADIPADLMVREFPTGGVR